MNEQIIGLDISTTTIGITIMNESGQLVNMTYIKPPKTSVKNGEVSIYDKVEYTVQQIKELAEQYNIKYIFIEEPLKNGNNVNTTVLLAKFNFMVAMKMRDEYKVTPIHITVHDVRKYYFPEYVSTKKVKGEIKETLSFPKNVDKKILIYNKVSNEIKYDWLMNKKGEIAEENYDMTDSYIIAKVGLNYFR